MKWVSREGWILRTFALAVVGLTLVRLPAPSAHAIAVSEASPTSIARATSGFLQFTSQGHVLGFEAGGFYVSNATYALRVEFVGANLVAPESDGSVSERASAPPLTRVTYANLWDGVTLTYDGARGGVVSSSYRLEAGADPRSIRLRYNVPVTINSDGTLTAAFDTGEMTESAPVAWQESEGERLAVPVMFMRLGEREIGFDLGPYNTGQALYVDPRLIWNTFLGGGSTDRGNSIVVDGAGNIYVTGTSDGAWGAPMRDWMGKNDAFAAKLSPSGALVWNTFLGGGSFDYGNAIALDGSGNVYVAGESETTWQGTNPPIRSFISAVDAFVAKLSPTGALTWNTFVGGGGIDYANGIVVDGAGNIYIAGTSDITWQGANPPARAFTNGYDGFAAKLDSSGAIAWNTFLGGSGTDYAWGIAIDGAGSVYIAGTSDATWQGAAPPIRLFGAHTDAYAAKLNSSGALSWNSFLGGSGYDSGLAVVVDGSGNVYVTGDSSATWQGTSAPIRGYSGSYDAFAAKLNSSGAVNWNTFLGGSEPDFGRAIVRDTSGNLYVAGFSYATWQATTPPVRAYTGSYDAFAVKLSSTGAVTWNTFLGGSGEDNGNGIAVDSSGNVYIAGDGDAMWQGSSPPVRAFTGSYDAFAVKLGPSGTIAWNTFFGGSSNDYGRSIAVDASGNIYVAGYSYSTWGSPVRNSSGGLDAFVAKLNPAGGLTWSTFLGGNGDDYGSGVAVDGSGNVYVTGHSSSSWQGNVLPVRPYTSGFDGFAAKLNSSGGLVWNTFLGGPGNDISAGIAADANGNVWVVGSSTVAWGSPIVRPYMQSPDAYVARLTPLGGLVWNSFLGGTGWDTAGAIAVDSIGNAYVAGASSATWQGINLPVRGFTSGTDAFAAKVNPGGGVVWNTFLGGTGYDAGYAIATDSGGSVYVAGYSNAAWQGSSAPRRGYTSGYDAFAAKLNSGGGLVWNSFVGGSGNDYGYGVDADASGNVYMTGYSTATWGLPARGYVGGDDGFVAKLSSSGSLGWNTFLGGTGYDYGYAIVVDGGGNLRVAGDSNAAWQGAAAPVRGYTSGRDAFVASIAAFDGYLPMIRR